MSDLADKKARTDPRKVLVYLVPGALVRAAARALEFGARKYAAHNWRRGLLQSEIVSAIERHAFALNDGERIDSDSGLHHADLLAAEVAFLCAMVEEGRHDDLYRAPLQHSAPQETLDRHNAADVDQLP